MQKEDVFNKIRNYIEQIDIRLASEDKNRPWGGFFVIDEKDAKKFINLFFPEIDESDLLAGARISPKILMVAPGKKLSWQYHHRRAEIWKLIQGTASVARSLTDVEEKIDTLAVGDIIKLKQGERHRLIGTGEWGIVAEIWMHTHPEKPSDEDDIVRLQDDFGR